MSQLSRRTFLNQATAGALAVSAARPLPSRSTPARVTHDWQAVREAFSFSEEKVPMNAANLCPSPREVTEWVFELTRDIDRDCSFPNRAKFETLREQSRTRIAAQLGVNPDEIALVRNTSEANTTINNGLPLAAGDEVVVWDQNHPTNNVAWEVRAARFGTRVIRVTIPSDPEGIEDLIEPFQRVLSPRTRVLALTHVSNVSGVRLPIRELAQLARARGVFVHVDGAQCWGAMKLDLHELGCDAYTASAHKWFLGPKEAGLLYVRQEQVPYIWATGVAPGWGDDAQTDLVGARKFESLGQRDDACLAALGLTAEFHDAIGLDLVESRVRELSQRLKVDLRGIGASLVTPQAPALSAGVCIVSVPAANRRALADRLYHEHGIAGAATGGLRLCPHIYNTDEHVERAVRAVRALRTMWQPA